MTQQIGITIQQQNLTVPLPALLSLLSAGPTAAAPAALTLPADFGAPLQGGIYVGPHWEDDKLVHLIAAPDTLDDQDWDGAKDAAGDYEGGGHSDWFLPSREQLEIARIYAQDAFEKVYHWSATPYGSNTAWAVDFEDGNVRYWYRDREFRVRPFRRFIA